MKPLLILLCSFTVPAAAHDMYLIVDDHDVPAHARVEIALYNGTFDESLNTISRDRMVDVSIVNGEGELMNPEPGAWRDEAETSILQIETGVQGDLLVGVSTRSRTIELSAEAFNEYLRHDGVVDVLRERERQDILGEPANERYSKHVKTLLQVGGRSGNAWQRRLGYPIEFVPLADPNTLAAGDTLQALLLADGEPLTDHLVYASYGGYHLHNDKDEHSEAVTTRTDANGVARINLSQPGRWYLRVIHMVESEEDGVDYESNWATLTFSIDGP